MFFLLSSYFDFFVSYFQIKGGHELLTQLNKKIIIIIIGKRTKLTIFQKKYMKIVKKT